MVRVYVYQNISGTKTFRLQKLNQKQTPLTKTTLVHTFTAHKVQKAEFQYFHQCLLAGLHSYATQGDR